MARYLGVDGGGSKTAFVLLDRAGRITAEAQGPSCYYFASGIELVDRVLSDGIARVTGAAGVDTAQIDYAFFGLPGYGEVGTDVPRLQAIPRDLLGHDRYTCDNDMIGGWAGALGGQDGINVVAGTGSMAYGEHRGAACRVGGWSELSGADRRRQCAAQAAAEPGPAVQDVPLPAVERDRRGRPADYLRLRGQGQRRRPPDRVVAGLARPGCVAFVIWARLEKSWPFGPKEIREQFIEEQDALLEPVG
jgi:hypothetical protein